MLVPYARGLGSNKELVECAFGTLEEIGQLFWRW